MGEAWPGVLEVLEVDEVRLSVFSCDLWLSVEVDPLGQVVTYILDVLWKYRASRERVERLSEIRRFTR